MNGQQYQGTDGIIRLTDEDHNVAEIPCLKSYSLEAQANFNTIPTGCMKSNGDGGTTKQGGWDKQQLDSKSWSGSAEFSWQKGEVGASKMLKPSLVGRGLSLDLFPVDDVRDAERVSGDVKVSSVSVAAEYNGIITQSVSFTGDGELKCEDI